MTRRVDRGVLFSFLLLILTGLVVLYAASYYNAQDDGSALSEVVSQLVGVGVGAALMLFVLRLDYRRLNCPAAALTLVGASLVLLVLVAIPGVGRMLNGSRRWLRVGPLSFQPSEMAKYAMILFLARALSAPGRDVRRFFTGLVPLFVVPGAMFLLILLQPNLSTAGSILIVAAVMVLMAGARWLHMGLIGVAGAALGTFYALSEDYRRARLMSFRDPFAYLTNEGYQLSQSLMAFGSGGLFGMGLGKGRQKYAFLPYPESDFIFAVVGEDLGFFGSVLVLAMFAAFVFFGLRVAMRCQDRFGSLLAGGITAMIGVQCVLNVAVVIGLMPTTGLPLPFFSAGGTSVSIVMGAVGLLLNISRDADPI
ncbi:MAG TPA: putative lipid II flippase FtsW [Candidatus Pullichristensenella avicola]|nr:putative lipid II flippase FtsW [Candidatus Pullichristensenella avicola]